MIIWGGGVKRGKQRERRGREEFLYLQTITNNYLKIEKANKRAVIATSIF